MVRITTNRTRLDAALADPRSTIMLISGDDGDPKDIHDLADEKITQPWRIVFLVTDLDVFTDAERDAWIDSSERYCVLGGSEEKHVAVSGPCSDLLRTNGRPSILSIRRAFAKGDQL